MATRTVGAGGGNYSAVGTWEEAAVPVDGDDVVFDSGSGDVVVDVDQVDVELNSLTMTGYTGTLAMASYTIDVDGAAILDAQSGGAITATAANLEVSGNLTLTSGMAAIPSGLTITLNDTGNITTAGVTGGNYVVNTAGAHTQIDKLNCDTFALTNGEHNAVGKHADVVGTISIAAGGDFNNTGHWNQTGSGNLANSSSSNPFAELSIGASGHTTTLTANIMSKKTNFGAGSVTGAFILSALYPTVDDFWTFAEGHSISVATLRVYSIYISKTLTLPNGMNLSNCTGSPRLWIVTKVNPSVTVTFNGEVNLGSSGASMQIEGPAILNWGAAAFTNLTAGGTLLLGSTGTASRFGKIDFLDGIHSIASLARANANDAANVCDFGTSKITVANTIDGAGIDFANTSARIRRGELVNVDCTGETELEAYGTEDGGNNVNVNFLALKSGGIPSLWFR